MNKAELTERIIDPKRIAKADLPELKSLAEKYSFSPIFSLLLLSGLSQHDDFSFEEELSEHAYRIPDRIRLFHLTHDIQTSVEVSLEETPENDMVHETLETPVSLEEELNTELSKENETAEIQDEIVSTEEIPPYPTFDTEEISETEVVEEKNLEPEEEENLASETSDTFEAFELDKSEEIETLEENDGVDEALDDNQEQETPVIDFSSLENSQDEEQENEEVPEVEETIEVEAREESKSTTADNLEVDMYAAAVSRSIELEVSENEIDSSTEPAEVSAVVEEITTSEKEEEDQTEPASINATTNEKAEEEPKDFFAWLAAKKEEKEQPKIKELVEATPTVPETIIDERKVEVEAKETPQNPTDKTEIEEEIKEQKEGKSKVDSIIEKFISEEPQISRPKKEFFSPSKVAKKSLDESSLPVSETLAQIFAAQGNYPKAIASYEQLMLKFPEKKSFFANQIKKLKQKLIK